MDMNQTRRHYENEALFAEAVACLEESLDLIDAATDMPHSYPAEVKRSLEKEFAALTRRCLRHSHPSELLDIMRDECKDMFASLGQVMDDALSDAILQCEGVKDGPIEVTSQDIEDQKYYVRMGVSR